MSRRRSSVQMLELTGSWGHFAGVSGGPEAMYIQCSACPADLGTPETELAELLVPVREIFNLEDLGFDQILQRDLDDNRVAHDLIPYLLDGSHRARFFPPILAVAVPFSRNTVDADYGEVVREYDVDDPEVPPDPEAGFPGGVTDTIRLGDAIRFMRFRDRGSDTYDRTARLFLSRQKTKLMVVDGQHRAMAILAIQRSLLNQWDRSGGEEYQHFYSGLDLSRFTSEELSRVELPVCICIFPELSQNQALTGGQTIPDVCRKIFLDVNKEARQPSKSRQILLDDYSLPAVFTRAVFGMARSDQEAPPTVQASLQLRHLEYDNPQGSIQVRKELAISNVRTIENAITWLLFRDDSYYLNPRAKPSRGRYRPNETRFRRVLDLENTIGPRELVASGAASITEITSSSFPLRLREPISTAFSQTWGRAILRFFSSFQPYQDHILAVDKKFRETSGPTGSDKLARQALFEGQGVWFVLEKHAEHQGQNHSQTGSPEGSLPPQEASTKALEAWRTCGSWTRAIIEDRASRFFAKTSPSPDQISSCNRTFRTLRTQAFQVGALMALAYLIESCEDTPEAQSTQDRCNRWISGANKAWESNTVKSRAFDTNSDGLLAQYPGQLSPHDWPFFRYAFLELIYHGLSLPTPSEVLALRSGISSGRHDLAHKISRKLLREATKQGKPISPDEATSIATDTVRRALKRTFGITQREFDELRTASDTQEFLSSSGDPVEDLGSENDEDLEEFDESSIDEGE